MSVIRHPNIVQYLGMFRDIDTETVTHLPMLLMELMDDSLTHCTSWKAPHSQFPTTSKSTSITTSP